MRTTLNIDDDLIRAVRSLAVAQGRSLSAVVSDLLRQALRPAAPVMEEGFPTFEIPPDAPPLTPEMVRGALEDQG